MVGGESYRPPSITHRHKCSTEYFMVLLWEAKENMDRRIAKKKVLAHHTSISVAALLPPLAQQKALRPLATPGQM